jgi:hypothetical protein
MQKPIRWQPSAASIMRNPSLRVASEPRPTRMPRIMQSNAGAIALPFHIEATGLYETAVSVARNSSASSPVVSVACAISVVGPSASRSAVYSIGRRPVASMQACTSIVCSLAWI